ncbi:MarR family winged helix-turn-helix transcriptional regulator [Corynebacterium hindlerae]|uniref:MarR family winged helix-turn-helix transcriptional regulator n=1 Tax=Corynebacterium hindlerae TaxID=699041 RepID=UPI003AAFDD1E
MAINVEKLLAQWSTTRPELDPTPMRLTAYTAQFAHHARQLIDANLAHHGLHQWQFDVLATLRRANTPLTAKELAEQVLISASALTNRLDKLTAEGLISRSVNPSSRRESLIELTDEGRQLIDAILPSHLGTCRTVAERLSPAEADQLCGLLKKALGE